MLLHACTHSPPGARDLDAVREYIGQLPRTRRSAAQVFAVEGVHYVVKYRSVLRCPAFRAWSGALACTLMFGEFPSPSRLRVGGLAHQARRARELAAAGQAVPAVLLETADYLLFEYCGPTVEAELHRLGPAARPALLAAVVDDLAAFHRAGFWHGGAQLRNLTLKDGRIHRIDFEENTGAALSLPLAQAYDVFLTFNAMTDWLDGEPGLGEALLWRYLDRLRLPEVPRALRRLSRLLQALAPWLVRLRLRHDLRRTLAFARILHHILGDASSGQRCGTRRSDCGA